VVGGRAVIMAVMALVVILKVLVVEFLTVVDKKRKDR
jgi:uncharacterized membrane protein